MDRIIWYQLAGLLGAIILQVSFCGVVVALSRRLWPFIYLVAVIAVCSIFSLQAFFDMQLFLKMLLAAVMFGGGFLFIGKVKLTQFLPAGRLAWVAAAVIALDLLYAAFPDYRYDQWDYHLLVGKQIVRSGPFSLPVMFDHIYFSGIYEFLTVIPRLFWDNDLFAHCFSNAFSFLVFLLPLGGLVFMAVEDYKIDKRLGLLLLGALLFSIPDHEVVVSSKPDPLLIVYALAVLYLLVTQKMPERLRFFFLGFFLCGPVSFKLTYLHFGAAVGVAALALILLKRLKMSKEGLSSLFFGVALSTLLGLPFYVKNYEFFGNPVHPVQVAFLKSTYWSSEYEGYWRRVSGSARDIGQYVSTLVSLPSTFLKMSGWFLGIIAAAALLLRRPSVSKKAHSYAGEWLLVAMVTAVFLFLWPLFYKAQIFPRFVYPVFGVLVLATIVVFAEQRLAYRWAVVVLLVPLIANSSLDVKVNRLSNAHAKPEDFFDNGRMPYKHWLADNEINQHRSLTFPDAGYREHRTMVESPLGYFLDSERLDITSNDFSRYYELSVAEWDACVWKILDQYDINYLRSIYLKFEEWPEIFTEVVRASEPLGKRGLVRYISEETVQSRLAECASSN